MESFSEIFQSECWIKVLWSKHKYCISLLGCLTGKHSRKYISKTIFCKMYFQDFQKNTKYKIQNKNTNYQIQQLIGMFDRETFSKIHFENNILQNVFPRGTLLNLLWHICFLYRWKLPIYKSVTVPIFHHLGQIAVERKEFPYAEPIIDLWKTDAT